MARFHNRTRTAPSIPRKLLTGGRLHLLPPYYLLRLSDLAREGMDNSGSYRFADHVYAARASGRLGVGTALDWVLLRLPSARALRERYLQAKAAILERVALAAAAGPDGRVRVLLAPSGLGRELFEAHDELPAGDRHRLEGYGLDLDAELVARLERRAGAEGRPFRFVAGDAFDPDAYPAGPFDLIVSTGFTEFLSDEDTVRHYAILRNKLAAGGTLLASAMRRHALSDYLLRNLADLHTNYREPDHLVRLCRRAGFDAVTPRVAGLQTIALARHEP